MTLGPLVLIILLGLAYLAVSLTKNNSSKNNAETAHRIVYLVPDSLRGLFTATEERRFKKLFTACDSNGSGKIDIHELRSLIKKYASNVDDSEIEDYAMDVLAEASNQDEETQEQDAAVVDDTTAGKDISFAQVRRQLSWTCFYVL